MPSRLAWAAAERPARRRDYSQVVSAALVTVRSSGNSVGSALAPRLSWTLTCEPLAAGLLTPWKSEPSTTRTILPNPVTRSIGAFDSAEETVAAACSLPGENSTLVFLTVAG